MPAVKITLKPINTPLATFSSSSSNVLASPRGHSPAKAMRESPKASVHVTIGNYDTCLYLKESQVKGLIDISTTLLTIETVLAEAMVTQTERAAWGSNLWQINVQLPGVLSNQQWVVAGNEAARKALVTDCIVNIEQTQLVIHDRLESYIPHLNEISYPFRPSMALTLTTLQLLVAAHSEQVLQSLNHTLLDKTLPELKQLELNFAENEQACSYIDNRVQLKQEWAKIPDVLATLYKEGFEYLPQSLKHLTILGLLESSTQAVLMMLIKRLPQLHTLKLILEQPTMQLQQKRGRALSSSAKYSVLQRTESAVLIDKGVMPKAIKLFSPEYPAQLTLRDVLEKHANHVLKRLEILDNSQSHYQREGGDPSLFSPILDINLLTEYIEAGFLSGMSELVFGSTMLSFYENLDNREIEWQDFNVTAIDIGTFLKTVIDKKLPIKTVQFIAREAQQYKAFFEHIVLYRENNIFRELETIYYWVPPVVKNSRVAEPQDAMGALQDLVAAIRKGYLPALKSVTIEGHTHRLNLSQNDWDTIDGVANASLTAKRHFRDTQLLFK